jgi:hypothetical protein
MGAKRNLALGGTPFSIVLPRFADRCLSWWLFAETRAIMDACRTAWDNSITRTGCIQSLTNAPWVG